MNIDEQIQIERESLEVAIFPRERREHAEKLAKLELKRAAESRCAMFDLWRNETGLPEEKK